MGPITIGIRWTMNKTSKTYKAIEPLAELILNGRLLCVDPSTGSTSSVPGFAVYEGGELIESGEITVDKSANRSLRLYEIARTIREEFDTPDILIVEYIPHMVYGQGKMNGVTLMALQKAIGAIIGAIPCKNLLEIPASAWKHHKPEGYIKSDEWDAIALGNCAINISKKIVGE